MSVYRLRERQYGYCRNVINFSQNVQEFVTKFPWHPSSLDVLVIRCQYASNSETFRDFKVHHTKVAHALIWLKENNRYYADIIINHEVLQSLPIDSPIDNQLRDITKESDNENEEDVITRTFVLFLSSTHSENDVIKYTLDRMQNENRHIIWPQIRSEEHTSELQSRGLISYAVF